MAWPYCKTTQFSLYVDLRICCDLLTDLNAKLADAQNDPAGAQVAVAASAMLAEALKAGATDIDMAMIDSRRYDVDAMQLLAEIPTDGAPDHGVFLRRLNAGLAVRFLNDRRVRPEPESEETRTLGKWAAEVLEQIRLGHNVIPARAGPLTVLSGDPTTAAAQKAAGRGAVESAQSAGLPDAGTSTVGISTCVWPYRMFGQTSCQQPCSTDPLNTGYRDWWNCGR